MADETKKVNERLTCLFRKQLVKECSSDEKQEFMNLMADPANEHQVNELLKDHWEAFEYNDDLAANIFQPGQGEEMLNMLLTEHVYPELKTAKSIRLWPSNLSGPRFRTAVAAAVAAILFGMGLFIYKNSKKSSVNTTAYHNDITPGSFGATLTLANGRKIALSDAGNGQLAREAGVIISKSADGQLIYEISASASAQGNLGAINTLTTAKGQTYMIILPDKSKVWMNAASTLSYSAALLERGKRKVKLEGEAYFEISKDKTHPFVVETAGQQVEVLGTHFNINSYDDESSIKTTLLEGCIRIDAKNADRVKQDDVTASAILYPNQQAILNKDDKLSVTRVETADVVAWKNGITSFKNAEIKTIMRQIARWYDIEVQYEEGIPKKLFSGEIPRNANLSELIKVIEFAGVKFEVKGRTILVKQ